MSELAPFVAAVLRDKSMEALQKENDRLREIMSVQVTGPAGLPVYAHGSLVEHGNIVDYDDYQGWAVRFEEEKLAPCLAEELNTVEFRVGGVVVMTGADLMDHENGRVFEECMFDEETGYCEFQMYNLDSLGMSYFLGLYFNIGPYQSINEFEEAARKLGMLSPYIDLPSCRHLEQVCNLIFFQSIELDYEKVGLLVKACQRQRE